MNNTNPPPTPPECGAPLLDGYIDKSSLATAFRVSERTIDRWCDLPDGLPYIKVGRTRLFSVSSFRSWLAGREAQRNRRRRAS